ncbi:Rieske 2Fe-2S domain-containing protein [Paenarthrobacter sp. PAE-2]|uniref:Rieske 2Fe-2S domain-containing protein n=1 Tax=Paenarthrobacter sp. PAE-2 TaxID=2982532 RepID=UPI0029F4ACDE|nr:Rieske 2Fe-2S domain-containing protein [Paenarthrobacter sp. PAE-2]
MRASRPLCRADRLQAGRHGRSIPQRRSRGPRHQNRRRPAGGTLYFQCLHRGMQVCRTEMGNASHFRCPYHGWSYRNDGRIVGLPLLHEAKLRRD